MQPVSIAEAQLRLDELLAAAAEGEEVVIARADGAAFQIVRRTDPPGPRSRPRLGSGRELFVINDSFYEPIDEFRDYEP